MSFAGFIYGIILSVIGYSVVRYSYQLTNMFSRNNVFERHLGSGSTYTIMKLVGVLVMFSGLLTMFGLIDNVARWFVSPITNLISR